MNNFQENTNPDESIATIKRDNQELLNEDKTKKIENEN